MKESVAMLEAIRMANTPEEAQAAYQKALKERPGATKNSKEGWAQALAAKLRVFRAKAAARDLLEIQRAPDRESVYARFVEARDRAGNDREFVDQFMKARRERVAELKEQSRRFKEIEHGR